MAMTARWGLPLVVFFLSGVGLVMVARTVRLPQAPSANGEARAAPRLVISPVESLSPGGLLGERLALFDPRPLFLPVSGAGIPGATEAMAPQPGSEVVGDIPPALQFPERMPMGNALRPELVTTPIQAEEALSASRWFDGLARESGDMSGDPVAVRAARVEIFRIGAEERVAVRDTTKAAGLEAGAWRPLTLTVLISAEGAVSQPVVSVSSGVDEVDERIRWIVGRELLPTLRLRPGVYRMEVGP